MRKIRFRGQKTSNGIWVYGSLVYSNELDSAIYFQVGNGSVKSMEWAYVKPDTVGQYTGMNDDNGNEIYEGDILQVEDVFDGEFECIVVFDNKYRHAFRLQTEDGCLYDFNDMRSMTVIGNIHDNPELLKEE